MCSSKVSNIEYCATYEITKRLQSTTFFYAQDRRHIKLSGISIEYLSLVYFRI